MSFMTHYCIPLSESSNIPKIEHLAPCHYMAFDYLVFRHVKFSHWGNKRKHKCSTEETMCSNQLYSPGFWRATSSLRSIVLSLFRCFFPPCMLFLLFRFICLFVCLFFWLQRISAIKSCSHSVLLQMCAVQCMAVISWADSPVPKPRLTRSQLELAKPMGTWPDMHAYGAQLNTAPDPISRYLPLKIHTCSRFYYYLFFCKFS